ncbi:MAG TPA: hypothetical protein VG053_10450 [Solirubrobacteraceae bacterium]|nr:hypothetical protein [Solirubrobacteraceae bacterium]
MRPLARALALALTGAALAVSLSACETTAEKSAKLEQAAHHTRLAEKGLTIARPSDDVRVLSAILVRGREGNAAVIALHNTSSHALRAVPIAITVKDAHGTVLFQNNTAGLEPALTSLGSLAAHGAQTWIDDQILTSGTPASVSAIVGEAPSVSGAAPRIEVHGVHASEEGGTSGAAGTVRNGSSVTQQNLVVYVLARRGNQIVAAGRAVLPEVGAGASLPFQAFLQGDASGARLEASAPATAFG